MFQYHIGDNILTAYRNDTGNWTVTSVDMHNMNTDVREVSDSELAAIMALVIAGDDAPAYAVLRVVADNATAGWKSKLIP